MSNLLGEYECKLDAKFRLALPAGLLKQLPPEGKERLVINRGFERHLVLYPGPEWEAVSKEVDRLNEFDKDNRQFSRRFYGGATALALDSQNRLLLPRRLVEYAAIKDRVVINTRSNKMELWATEVYDQIFDDDPEEFAALAQKVLGDRTAAAED